MAGLFGVDFFGGSNAGTKPQWNDPQFGGGTSMTTMQHAQYQQAMNRWNIKNQEREKRRKIFQDMAQTPGPTPKDFRSSAGQKEFVETLAPVQVAGGPAPSDPMARYGRPKRWPYLQSIVNMGQLA